jgi:ankyrin repeat protein
MRKIDYREIFADNSPEALIGAVKNGLDVYLRETPGRLSDYPTFFGAAVRWGTPELVKACVEMGADVNCADPQRARHSSPRARTSSLIAAMRGYNPETLRALFEHGARTGVLNGLLWGLERNIFPEAAEDDEEAKEIKKRLDAGAEILKILHAVGFSVPGLRADDEEMSFYTVGSLYSSEGSFGDDEENAGKNSSGKYSVWEDWDEKYADGGDDSEDKYDRYCEGLEEFFGEYSFPSHGTRPGALWHAASPEALRQMLEAGTDVNACDAAGWTTLHHVAYCCLDDYYFKPNVMIQMLLDAGAEIDKPGRYEMAPLDLAAMWVEKRCKALETVKLLLRNGAKVTGSTFYWIRDYWYVSGTFEKIILQEILPEMRRSVRPDEDEDENENEKNGSAGKNPPLDAVDLDLMTAAFWGRAEDLALPLARGANINARSKNGFTPLMFASVYNYAPSVRFLIENGADVNARNAVMEDALMYAIKTGDRDMIETLVEMGADINSANKWGITPLMQLITYRGGSLDMLQDFIRRGADVNAKDEDGNTPLIAAIQSDFRDFQTLEIVGALLDAGAKIDEKNAEGKTALDVVLSGENSQTIPAARLLLARGANPRLLTAPEKTKEEAIKEEMARKFSRYGLKAHARFKDVFTDNGAEAVANAAKNGVILELKNFEDKERLDFYKAALRYGSSEIVKACLGAGGGIDESWEGGDWVSWQMFPESWPLYHAIDARNAEAVKTLVEAGADLSNVARLEWNLRVDIFPEDLSDKKALEFKTRLDAGAEILKTLHDAGAPVQCRDREGRELTYVGVGVNRRARARDNDADETTSDMTQTGCLPCGERAAEHAAALRRAASPKALAFLIESGAGVDARDSRGRTAMHFIARDCEDYFEPGKMIEVLIGAGANADASDENGVTPLMLAAENIKKSFAALDVVKELLSGGADSDARDKEGKSAWDRGGGESIFFEELLDAVIRAFGREGSAEKRGSADLMIAACRGGEEEIEEALARGAKVNVQTQKGCTPLLFASAFNGPAAVKCLIAHGADLDARNARGKTALHLAVGRSDSEAVRAFIEAGADINAADGGYTPLMLAALVCKTGEIAQMLLEAGADTGRQRLDEKDALHIALDKKHFRVVRALLAAGVELGEPDEDSSEDSDDADEESDTDKEDEIDEEDESLSKAASLLREYGLKV